MKKNNNYEMDLQQLETVTGGALAENDNPYDFPTEPFPLDPSEYEHLFPVKPIELPDVQRPIILPGNETFTELQRLERYIPSARLPNV